MGLAGRWGGGDAFSDLVAERASLSVPGGLDLLEADRLGVVCDVDYLRAWGPPDIAFRGQ
jgi:hypothetical protein